MQVQSWTTWILLDLKHCVIDLRLSENFKISMCGWICNYLQVKRPYLLRAID